MAGRLRLKVWARDAEVSKGTLVTMLDVMGPECLLFLVRRGREGSGRGRAFADDL